MGEQAHGDEEVQARVRQQYELWPYPAYPWFAKVRPHTVWQLHTAYLASRCGLPPPSGRARIWIAGCGTFQPHVFATANPDADILATDLSAASLRLARRRCRWRGQRHVDFAPSDLSDPRTLPDGPFDLIECYGVLMCVPDPLATLRQLAARLAPHGVLRLMVYPHFSRQRVFQLQRAARLLGLHHRDRRHPRLLRQVVAALPRAHPLRHAFVTYDDARNDAGLADAFLHPHDRGFTGLELGAMVRAAGLEPGFFFHRPWAQPAPMAQALGFGARDPFAVLHYLDLWQELRGNFVVCLRRPGEDTRPGAPRLHPLLAQATPGLDVTHRARLLWGRLAGLSLHDRTCVAPVRVPARALRGPRPGRDAAETPALVEAGVLLAPRPRPRLPEPGLQPPPLPATIWRGAGAPNPLYAHLFAALTTRALPGLPPLGDAGEQVVRWHGHAEALEGGPIRFGLTPVHTYRTQRQAVDLALAAATTPCASWDEVRLRHESVHLRALADRLASAGLEDRMPRTAAARRELGVLLGDPTTLRLDVE